MKELYCETDRLIIRPFVAEDYEEWHDGFEERLPSTYTYDDGFQENANTYTKEWFVDWIQGFDEAARKDEMYILGVFRKKDGKNVGKLELFKILRMDYDWAMMGYSIHNQFFRQGYGKESVQAAAQLFFEQLDFHRIELHINVDNEPSKKLAESAGFQFECIREKFSRDNGVWTDFLIYYQNRSK